MEYISGWARGIITLVFLSSFSELLITNDSIKKYIRVVAGFLVILYFFKPLASIRDIHIEVPETKMYEYNQKTEEYVSRMLEDERWKALNQN